MSLLKIEKLSILTDRKNEFIEELAALCGKFAKHGKEFAFTYYLEG
jgi:hypothetical protein